MRGQVSYMAAQLDTFLQTQPIQRLAAGSALLQHNLPVPEYNCCLPGQGAALMGLWRKHNSCDCLLQHGC